MKNKEMFFYFSLLVERHIFDEISMGFLIVGHTHSSIDQFFSVLCTAIEASKFIGSPMALHELYSKCSNDQRMIPKRQRQIRVEFDYVSAFKPYLNKNIMYYNVPHNFLFRCVWNNLSTLNRFRFSFIFRFIGDNLEKLSCNTNYMPAMQHGCPRCLS